jgi:hypothetical protein
MACRRASQPGSSATTGHLASEALWLGQIEAPDLRVGGVGCARDQRGLRLPERSAKLFRLKHVQRKCPALKVVNLMQMARAIFHDKFIGLRNSQPSAANPRGGYVVRDAARLSFTSTRATTTPKPCKPGC